MRLRYLLVLFVSVAFGIVAAQTAPKPASKPATAPAKAAPATKPAAAPKAAASDVPAASTVAPDTPVITVVVPCDKKPADPKQPGTCTQSITRAEFEKLSTAVSPQMSFAVRRSFAQNLARLMVYSAEAKRRGLDKSDQVREMMKVATMQVYAQELARKTQEEAANITPPEMEAFYRDNQPKFENFTLSRIIIPRRGATKDNPVNEEEQKAFAQKIRDRWAAGEDGDKLQKEAYEHAGNTSTVPPVKLGDRRRGSLSPSQDSVFTLKAGEVSQPFNDPSASFIYKVESRQIEPLTKVLDEVKRALTNKRLEATIDGLMKNSTTTLDTTYFEMSPEGGAPGAAKPPAPAPAATTQSKPPASDKDQNKK